MNPLETLNFIDNNNGIYLKVYNTRTNREEFGLHKTPRSYLLQSDRTLEVLDKPKAIKIIDQLNDLIKKSRFRAFAFGAEL